VKKWLKSIYICGSYRKIKTGVSLFWTTRYIFAMQRCILIIQTQSLADSFQRGRCSTRGALICDKLLMTQAGIVPTMFTQQNANC